MLYKHKPGCSKQCCVEDQQNSKFLWTDMELESAIPFKESAAFPQDTCHICHHVELNHGHINLSCLWSRHAKVLVDKWNWWLSYWLVCFVKPFASRKWPYLLKRDDSIIALQEFTKHLCVGSWIRFPCLSFSNSAIQTFMRETGASSQRTFSFVIVFDIGSNAPKE